MHITDKLKDVDITVLRLLARKDGDARDELFRRQVEMKCHLHFEEKHVRAAQARRKTMTNTVAPATGTEKA